jgi:hypothetical protein
MRLRICVGFREAYVIFSGGMPYDQAGRTPSITVVHSKTTTVLEMEHNVVDFITLCESPYTSGKQIIESVFLPSFSIKERQTSYQFE